MNNTDNDLSLRIKKLDSIVYSVINKFTNRAEVGYNKYKTNMDRTDLTIVQWIDHSIEEKMDDIIYMEKIKQELLKNNYKNMVFDSDNTFTEKEKNHHLMILKILLLIYLLLVQPQVINNYNSVISYPKFSNIFSILLYLFVKLSNFVFNEFISCICTFDDISSG